MNINTIRTIPQDVTVAFSGGVDSVVLVHKALSQNKNVRLAFYNHGNELAYCEEKFVEKFAEEYNLELIIERCTEQVTGSSEKFWRDCRYKFFKQLGIVATGHHLDDAVEWYLLTCLRGEGHYMNYQNENVIRPFILNKKSKIVEYASYYGLKWFDDFTNRDSEFTYRNKIRKDILPSCLEINPGLYNMVSNNIKRKTQHA